MILPVVDATRNAIFVHLVGLVHTILASDLNHLSNQVLFPQSRGGHELAKVGQLHLLLRVEETALQPCRWPTLGSSPTTLVMLVQGHRGLGHVVAAAAFDAVKLSGVARALTGLAVVVGGGGLELLQGRLDSLVALKNESMDVQRLDRKVGAGSGRCLSFKAVRLFDRTLALVEASVIVLGLDTVAM